MDPDTLFTKPDRAHRARRERYRNTSKQVRANTLPTETKEDALKLGTLHHHNHILYPWREPFEQAFDHMLDTLTSRTEYRRLIFGDDVDLSTFNHLVVDLLSHDQYQYFPQSALPNLSPVLKPVHMQTLRVTLGVQQTKLWQSFVKEAVQFYTGLRRYTMLMRHDGSDTYWAHKHRQPSVFKHRPAALRGHLQVVNGQRLGSALALVNSGAELFTTSDLAFIEDSNHTDEQRIAALLEMQPDKTKILYYSPDLSSVLTLLNIVQNSATLDIVYLGFHREKKRGVLYLRGLLDRIVKEFGSLDALLELLALCGTELVDKWGNYKELNGIRMSVNTVEGLAGTLVDKILMHKRWGETEATLQIHTDWRTERVATKWNGDRRQWEIETRRLLLKRKELVGELKPEDEGNLPTWTMMLGRAVSNKAAFAGFNAEERIMRVFEFMQERMAVWKTESIWDPSTEKQLKQQVERQIQKWKSQTPTRIKPVAWLRWQSEVKPTR